MQPPTYPPAYDESQLPPPWWHDRLKVGLVAAVVGLLGLVAMILFLVVLNASGGGGATASPTATPSTSSSEPIASPSSSMPEASETPTASSAASASASASASPSSEPQAELALGWNRIDTALNLRGGPGEDSPVVRRLQPGELVWIDSEAVRDEEYTWYYAQTLTEDSGYLASGPSDEPYASLVSNRFVFSSCGSVATSGNFGFVNGLRTTRLNDFELEAFALASTMDTRGCVRYSMENYDPKSKLTLEVHACGAPFQDGSSFGLLPVTSSDVDQAWLVDESLIVADLLLTSGQAIHDDGLTNHKKLLILARSLTTPLACVTAEVKKREDNRRDLQFVTDLTACLVMTQNGSDAVTFAPASGGEGVRLLKDRRGKIADVTLNDPNILHVHAVGRRVGSQLVGDC